MLTRIQPRTPTPAAASLADALRAGDASDAVDLLLGCHQRIRHFTAMARRLAAPGAPPDQIPAAAAAVYRYYSEALPLHEADENESVYPRLRDSDPSATLAQANQAMVEQHRVIDQIIATLLPQWGQLVQRPARAPETASAAEQLEHAWAEHLELEERLIFPALRQHLNPKDRADIRAEMAGRRKIG